MASEPERAAAPPGGIVPSPGAVPVDRAGRAPDPSLLGWGRWRASTTVSTAVGLAGCGVLLFAVAVDGPLWRGLIYGAVVEDLVAVGGGVLFVVGLTLAWDVRSDRLRARQRPPPSGSAELLRRLGPSLEVYDPRADAPGSDPRPAAPRAPGEGRA
jgi:hypothetical protein